MDYLMYIIIASHICTGLVNEGSLSKPSKFPYSKCMQTENDVICEPLNIHKGEVVNSRKSEKENEHNTNVEIESGHKQLMSPYRVWSLYEYGADYFEFYFQRLVTVSKIEMKSKYVIPDGVHLFDNCYYYNIVSSQNKTCDLQEVRNTSHIVNLYFRNMTGRHLRIRSIFYLRLESSTVFILDPGKSGGRCYENLGIEDGSIQDFQISASSWTPQNRPSDARLTRSGWIPRTSDEKPWFMVDLIAETTIEGMIIESNVESSKIVDIYAGTEIDNLHYLFKVEYTYETYIEMPKPVKARYIKAEILQINIGISLRFEVIGCKLSGVPALNCYKSFEIFEISSGISTEEETITHNISTKEICNNICLQNDNCRVVIYTDKGECIQYMRSYVDNWQVGTSRIGDWFAKLCVKDPVELFPTLRDESGIIVANVAYIDTTALITSIGYPFAYGNGHDYKWIVKFVENKYINIIFTNASFESQDINAVSPCNLLMLTKYINSTTEGKTIDYNFNDRSFVVETGVSLLILTFTSCVTNDVITSRGFRALVTEKDIPACLSIDSDLSWREGRHEICSKPKMILTSMSILNFPFVHEERWDIQAGEHHSVQIKVLEFYVICPNDEAHWKFSVVDFDKYTFCNTDRPPDIFNSKNKDVQIIFRNHDDPAVKTMRKEGFRILYKTISDSLEHFVDVEESTSNVCSKAFDKCYNVSLSFSSWKESAGVCREHNQRLVTVQSKSELHFIQLLLLKAHYQEERLSGKAGVAQTRSAHIGLSRVTHQYRKKKYVWQNNSPMAFTSWRSGNPTKADCTRIAFQNTNEDDTWESEDCSKEMAGYLVCETKLEERAAENRKSDTRNLEACGLKSINVNVTYSGKSCQRWDALTPNATEDFRARFGNLTPPTTSSNNCKYQQLNGILWCYIIDRNQLREPCFLNQPLENETNESTQTISMQHYQCSDKTVIPQINRCDGLFDCRDNSDEIYCRDVIGNHLLIDTERANNDHNLPIGLEIGSYYRCLSKEWISIIARCDGFIDCLDASDELNCNRMGTECNGNEFECADGNCVHISLVCDFIPDCPNAEDEYCEIKGCRTDEFACDNMQCIPDSKRCNAIPDCIDSSDEHSCESCRYSLRCDMNKCIQPRLRCDGFQDCEDGSDEISCLHANPSSCEEWLDLGHFKSGKYIIDDMAVDCDFSSFNTVSRKITMSIRNIDVSFNHSGTRDSASSKVLMNKEGTDGNKFRDIISRNNYKCVFQVKQNCHFPESEASSLDDPQKKHIYAYCQCVVETLKAKKSTNMTPVNTSLTRSMSEITFKRVDLKQCNGTKISQQRGFPKMYYTFINTGSFHVDRRIVQKMIPVEITAGPLTCSHEYTGEKFHCKREDKQIPKSMRCVYDIDATGYTTGCRSGNHLENCDIFSCPVNTVKCPNNFCIPQRFVCDGTIQCPNGEDEIGCTCRDFGREILILTEEALLPTDSSTAAVDLARQLYTHGSIIRLLRYNANSESERFSVNMTLLEIHEEHIFPFEAVERKRKCQYKSIARNVLQSIQFSEINSKGIIFIEDSEVSSTVANEIFSKITKPAFTIYRVFKKLNPLHRSPGRYTYVKDIPVNKWKSLSSLGYKHFPEICKAGLQVPCNGGYRCSSSKQCLPLEQICDGIVHCVNGDDERLCDFKCPRKCKCDGLDVKCRSAGLTEYDIRDMPFNTRGGDFSQNPGIGNVFHNSSLRLHFMSILNVSSCEIEIISSNAFLDLYNLRILDIGHNKFKVLPENAFGRLHVLSKLIVSSCEVEIISSDAFWDLYNLQSLDIGNNKFKVLPENVFRQLHHLTELNLDGNLDLTEISSSAFHGLRSIQSLRISGTKIKQIVDGTFSGLQLKSIDISNNEIEEIEDSAFSNLSEQYIDFKDNNIVKFNKLLFKDVRSLRELHTPAFKFCCILVRPWYMEEDGCYPAKNEFSSCGDLMRHPILQGMLWIVGIAALLGNFGSILYRLVYDRERLKIGYGIFVTNLAAADFLMSVYLMIIATVDSLYRKRYIYMDDQWRNSTLCVTAGILSMVSSEASVLFVCLITLDRLLVIKYPFGTIRFLPRRAHACCCISWVIAIALAVIPVFYTSYFENKFYSRSGVCVALPLTRDKPPGWVYSVAIFVGLNFCTFLLVAFGQLSIFLELRKTSGLKKTQISRKRDLQVARNLILVATTDFLCWFPIGLMGIMALSGHPITGDVYAWTAVFVLPLNSALNPILYTLTAIIGKRSFNPSTEEQNRTNVQKEIGIGIMQCLKISRSVRMTTTPVAEMRSVQDILNQDECISVLTVAAFSRQLAKFIRLLHRSCVGLEQLDETNTYISIDKSKKMIVVIDSKTTISTDKKLIEDNIYKYGVLLRKLNAKCNKPNRERQN